MREIPHFDLMKKLIEERCPEYVFVDAPYHVKSGSYLIRLSREDGSILPIPMPERIMDDLPELFLDFESHLLEAVQVDRARDS